jgi:hypothetical protein
MDQTGRTAGGASNEALLDRLGRTLAALDPAPACLETSARQLLAWRTVDAELAELLRAGAAHAPTPTD